MNTSMKKISIIQVYIFVHVLGIKFMSTCEIALRWIQQNLRQQAITWVSVDQLYVAIWRLSPTMG